MTAWSAFCVALSTNLTCDLSLPAPINVHGLADPLDLELLPPAPPVHLAALDLMDNPIMDGELPYLVDTVNMSQVGTNVGTMTSAPVHDKTMDGPRCIYQLIRNLHSISYHSYVTCSKTPPAFVLATL